MAIFMNRLVRCWLVAVTCKFSRVIMFLDLQDSFEQFEGKFSTPSHRNQWRTTRYHRQLQFGIEHFFLFTQKRLISVNFLNLCARKEIVLR